VPKTSVVCNHNQLQTDFIYSPSYAIAKLELKSGILAPIRVIGHQDFNPPFTLYTGIYIVPDYN
jgi:hypothetical protein